MAGAWASVILALATFVIVTRYDQFRWWLSGARLMGRLLYLVGIAGLLQFQLAVEIVGPKITGELPDHKEALKIIKPGELIIVDANHEVLWQRPTHYIEVVDIDELPKDLVNALIASEDAEFWKHKGVDTKGVLRAILYVAQHRKFGPGGSTITMQAIKNLVTKEKFRGPKRKVAEWLLAWQLERELSKQEIMVLYWNWAYLGAGRQGPVKAAQYYWGKELKDLTLAQSALLAGLVQSPENYRPDLKPEAARKRRHYVLTRMLAEGYITQEQFEQADAEEVQTVPVEDLRTGYNGWIVQMVLPQLEKHLTEEQLRIGGITVRTTIRKEWQQAGHKALNAALRTVDERQGFTKPLTGVSLSSEVPKLGSEEVVARVSEIDDTFLRFEMGGGSSGKVRIEILDRFMVVPKKALAKHKRDHRKWKKAHGKWKRRYKRWLNSGNKGEQPEEPEEPVAPKPMLKWKKGDYIKVDVIDTVDEDPTRFWVSPSRLQGVYVLVDPRTHDIRALVCGDNFRLSQVNLCTRARQPGSTFKPFTYLTALFEGTHTPWGTSHQESPERLIDEKRTYTYEVLWEDGKGSDTKSWSPSNYKGEFRDGPMTLREGLARSVNSIAVQIITHPSIGYQKVIRTIRKLGITSSLPQGPSIALGGNDISPLELAKGYATIGSGGIRSELRLITEVSTPRGEVEGLTLPRSRKQVFPTEVIWLLRHLMHSVVDAGSGIRLKRLPIRVDGKTGTTNDSKDTWFIGLDPYFVHVARVGFNRPRPIQGRRRAETGSSAALPVVKGAIEHLLQAEVYSDLPDKRDFQVYPDPPTGVVCIPIDPESGLLLADPPTDAKKECYILGTEPELAHVDTVEEIDDSWVDLSGEDEDAPPPIDPP